MNWNEFERIFHGCELVGNKIVIQSNLLGVIEFVLKEYPYDMLKEIIATDKGDEGVELTYHLYSVDDEEDLFISITVKDEIESVTGIFKSAEADENEIYDLFGIKFIGNENLKRLYMPEDWEGHPLRKDYKEYDKRLEWNDKQS